MFIRYISLANFKVSKKFRALFVWAMYHKGFCWLLLKNIMISCDSSQKDLINIRRCFLGVIEQVFKFDPQEKIMR